MGGSPATGGIGHTIDAPREAARGIEQARMVLWIAFAVLTAAVLAAVLAPLGRNRREAATADAGAVEVYRDQLGELDAERARGLIEESDAAAAKIEIARRLLASAAEAVQVSTAPATDSSSRRPLAIAIAVLIPLLTLAGYLTYGSPGLPGYPHAARTQVALENAQIGELVAKVEARLREHPEDGEGWDVIAPVYLRLGRLRDAADAFARAVRLKGESVRRLAGLAESSVLAADGVVTEDARLAYEKILKLEPGRPEARFWLALAKEQDGRLADAVADYKSLLSGAPADAPWRAAVDQRIAEVSQRLGGAQPSAPLRGPSAEDMVAAEKLAPADRARMIAGMVDGLAQRLKRDGRDLSGWLRLVNAYVVLGRKDDALTALADARKTFGGDEKALSELAALAKNLGLGS
jgi:cytochrome c-type biogenesis protein CcmH